MAVAKLLIAPQRWFQRWREQRAQAHATARLNAMLTPELVNEIVATMGGHVANGPRYGRESDLPYPRALIEAAFIVALRDAPNGPEFETLASFYVGLDSHMLSDADAETLKRAWHPLEDRPRVDFRELIDKAIAAGDTAVAEAIKGSDMKAFTAAIGPYLPAPTVDAKTAAQALLAAGFGDAVRIYKDLSKLADERLQTLDTVKAQRRLTTK